MLSLFGSCRAREILLFLEVGIMAFLELCLWGLLTLTLGLSIATWLVLIIRIPVRSKSEVRCRRFTEAGHFFIR